LEVLSWPGHLVRWSFLKKKNNCSKLPQFICTTYKRGWVDINSLKPRQKSEKFFLIKININCLYLPYNSLDRSWFPLFL
jgi:hypothetical protein